MTKSARVLLFLLIALIGLESSHAAKKPAQHKAPSGLSGLFSSPAPAPAAPASPEPKPAVADESEEVISAGFNPAQLCTIEQARKYAQMLSSGPVAVGGGVMPEDPDPNKTGIYLPEWLAGPGGFKSPSGVGAKSGKAYLFYHFRFRNGAQGVNAGLVIDKFRRFQTAPLYVLQELQKEVEALKK